MLPEKDQRLYLIDAYAMIFRGYYALIRSPRMTSKGFDTSAIFGFTNSLIELIRREKPSHLAVVFDVGKENVRTVDFADYKANRGETPEPIRDAIPYIHRILTAMHIPILGVEGYEADDVIGTISHKAEAKGYTVFMVTPDKDFAQLVTDKVKIYKPGLKGSEVEILGVEEVKAKYEIQDPKQVIDFLAMMGDSVDNIPGLEGVGEKTAKKYLQEYGSIENLLANTHQLKGKLKEKIEASAERGIMSKKLATIVCDVPVDFVEENYSLDMPDFQEVKNIFEELEFRRLYDNIHRAFHQNTFNENETKAEAQDNQLIASTLHLFSELENREDSKKNPKPLIQIISSDEELNILLKSLNNKTEASFYFSSPGKDSHAMCFSMLEGAVWAFSTENGISESKFVEFAKEFFSKKDVMKISHEWKEQLKLLWDMGIEPEGSMCDTSIAHYILNPDGKHDLDYLADVFLHQKWDFQISNTYQDISTFLSAIGERTASVFSLYQNFKLQLQENKLEKVLYSIEMPLLPVLARMELEGVKLDTEWLAQESKDLENDLKNLEIEIFKQSGQEFNINSPKQLGEILFDVLKLDPKAKKTKTGQYTTSEDVLQKLSDAHPIIPPILQYRVYQKLKSTYVDALPLQVNPKTSRVHTTFSQIVAATGRLASHNPNLQNIPIRTLRGQQIRGAFTAKDNYAIISADYSQIELRLIADFANETTMIEAFQKGEDIHATTAAQLFGIPLKDVTKLQRSQAKTVNFGIIYGVSSFGLSMQAGISRADAKELISQYYITYPKLKAYMADQVEKARETGYVETIFGRKRYLKEINSNNFVLRGHAERNAVNAPIQGSAADIIKLAMIHLDRKLQKDYSDVKMLLQVHDELVFEVPKERIKEAKILIKQTMEEAYTGKIPLLVEVGEGKNWLEAH